MSNLASQKKKKSRLMVKDEEAALFRDNFTSSSPAPHRHACATRAASTTVAATAASRHHHLQQQRLQVPNCGSSERPRRSRRLLRRLLRWPPRLIEIDQNEDDFGEDGDETERRESYALDEVDTMKVRVAIYIKRQTKNICNEKICLTHLAPCRVH